MQEQERIEIWLQDVSTNGGRYVRVERDALEKIEMNDVHEIAICANISAVQGEGEERRKIRDIPIFDDTAGLISDNPIQPNSESRDVT